MIPTLNFRKNYLNELIAIETGLKKVARQFVEEKDILEYLRFTKRRNLKFVFWKEKNYFYISKKKELARKVMKIEKKISGMNLNQNNFEKISLLIKNLGELFGYPRCCINFFINCLKNKEPNYVFYSYLNTKSNKISFLLNNLSVYRLISYFPCSYECKESLNFATKLFKNLPREQKIKTEEALKRDILIWNEEKMIGFNQRFNGRIINYNPEKINLLGVSEEIEKAIKKGNKLENIEDYIKIFWNDNLIFRYNKKSPEECFVLSFY